jgi:hypothetical protein
MPHITSDNRNVVFTQFGKTCSTAQTLLDTFAIERVS